MFHHIRPPGLTGTELPNEIIPGIFNPHGEWNWEPMAHPHWDPLQRANLYRWSDLTTWVRLPPRLTRSVTRNVVIAWTVTGTYRDGRRARL